MTETLARLATVRTTFIVGVVERRGPALFNTAIVVRDGRLLGRYAKTHPNEKAFAAGAEYPLFEADGWPFGINICNDANFPEAARRISGQGPRVLCYPLNNMLTPATAARWRDRGLDNLQRRAAETGCWVASSDVVGRRGDLVSHGLTCIVRPDGGIAARAAEEREGVALFDLI